MKKQQQILNALIDRINSMPTDVLHAEIDFLDIERQMTVINALTPAKFKELVMYDISKVEFSHLWQDRTEIKVQLLDSLSLSQLLHIGSQQRIGTSAWGDWQSPFLSENSKNCRHLSEYFSKCSNKRMVEIVSSLVRITISRSQRNSDIFVFNEKEQFPWETVALLSAVPPSKLFSALNEISLEDFNRMLWIIDKSCGEEDDTLEKVFNHWSDIPMSPEELGMIIKSMHLLENQRLFQILKRFTPDTQIEIVKALGKERIIKMNAEKCFSKKIPLPAGFKIFADKDSNEKILGNIIKGTTSVKKIGSRKTLELFGALVLAK